MYPETPGVRVLDRTSSVYTPVSSLVSELSPEVKGVGRRPSQSLTGVVTESPGGRGLYREVVFP